MFLNFLIFKFSLSCTSFFVFFFPDQTYPLPSFFFSTIFSCLSTCEETPFSFISCSFLMTSSEERNWSPCLIRWWPCIMRSLNLHPLRYLLWEYLFFKWKSSWYKLPLIVIHTDLNYWCFQSVQFADLLYFYTVRLSIIFSLSLPLSIFSLLVCLFSFKSTILIIYMSD